MLLIFATRYDVVTIRTFAVAEYLRVRADDLQVTSEVLFENNATRDEFNTKVVNAFEVFAFYSHGDDSGQILAQDGSPIWTDEDCPDFRSGVVFAHACRAMLALERQFASLNASVLAGYRIDLKLPPNGSDTFWEFYRQLHVLVPLRFAQAAAPELVRAEFYELATGFFDQLRCSGSSLIELIAVQQSRDELMIVK